MLPVDCPKVGRTPASTRNPLAALLLSILLFIALAPEMLAQMSPGPLSKPHQDLDGPLQCAKCHVFGAGSAQLRCLDCHQEIAHRLAEKRGYHAAQVKAGQGSNDCARCHAEHNGLKHHLVRWPVAKDKFDHAQAGWKLEGKHAQLKCAECHTARYVDAPDRAVLKRHDLNTTFAGLDPSCTSCHRDVHAGQLSARCTDCHSQDTWKNPPGFSHDRTHYPLTGLHARLACDKCHRPAAAVVDSPVQYKSQVLFNYCASCHKDPHGNAFSGDCRGCHTTGAWKQILPSNGFDHGRTDYPLLGKHAAAACKDCHQGENFKAHVPFARCLDCHQDQHGGQLARREDGGDIFTGRWDLDGNFQMLGFRQPLDVGMRIDEARQQRAAVQLDHLGVGADPCIDLLSSANQRDAITDHGHGGGNLIDRINCDYFAAADHQIGNSGRSLLRCECKRRGEKYKCGDRRFANGARWVHGALSGLIARRRPCRQPWSW